MIPKIIHYCWFGGAEKPKSVERCITSWRKLCPGYEILEWNEFNFDYEQLRYCSQAYHAKRWAFVSDYARLKIVLDQGGIYLDTDVELIKPLDDLISLDAFAGFQDSHNVATGLGFGAVAGHSMVHAMEREYHDLAFIDENGRENLTPCPVFNTDALIRHGLVPDGTRQLVGGMTILPKEYLCPIDFKTKEMKITENTVSIHHFDSTWYTTPQKIKKAIKNMLPTSVLKMVRNNN